MIVSKNNEEFYTDEELFVIMFTMEFFCTRSSTQMKQVGVFILQLI